MYKIVTEFTQENVTTVKMYLLPGAIFPIQCFIMSPRPIESSAFSNVFPVARSPACCIHNLSITVACDGN